MLGQKGHKFIELEEYFGHVTDFMDQQVENPQERFGGRGRGRGNYRGGGGGGGGGFNQNRGGFSQGRGGR
jgi:hypothetical protein